jgi:predicted DNA-binding protein with PD1-like motif
MKYDIGSVGRVVTARFEEGDSIYEELENLCLYEGIKSAVFWIIGGVQNVEVVTGPKDHTKRPLEAIVAKLKGVHEILGTGTIFRNENNRPKVHMHASLGHNSKTVTGCPRVNLDCWLINEVVLMEINGIDASRIKDSSGYELLTLGNRQEL